MIVFAFFPYASFGSGLIPGCKTTNKIYIFLIGKLGGYIKSSWKMAQ